MKTPTIIDLIHKGSKKPENIIPYDGKATYYGPILDGVVAQNYFDVLYKETPWQRDELLMYGKHIITERKIAWYGSRTYEYVYSNKTRTAIPFTKTLLELKEIVEKHTGVIYNSCLLNLYENGGQGLGWHFDKESRSPDSSIASLSLGEERRFDFRHEKTKETVSVILENGSLLHMQGLLQNYWKHQLPKSKKVFGPRINLTFRRIEPIAS